MNKIDYRKILYSGYVTNCTSSLYGTVDLNSFKKQFPVWQKYFVKHIPKDKDIKILEVGCGNGGFLYYLKVLGYENCYGIDIQ